MFKTEIEVFLNLPKVADFISVAMEISLDEYKKLSDFERFALVCDRSDTLLGSEVITRFFDLLYTLCEENFNSQMLKQRNEQIRAWRRIHGDNCENSRAQLQDENYRVDYYKLYDNCNYVNITEFLFENLKGTSKSLDGLLENVYNSEMNSFLIYSSELEYSRPDEYHANAVYQKILIGEKCKKNELGLLASYVICNVGKRKKCYVRYFINDINDTCFCVEDLAELFEKRNSNVKINVCFDPFSFHSTEKLFDIMLKKGKKISSEIIIPEDVDVNCIYECFTNLLKTIPFSRIRLCGSSLGSSAELRFEKAIHLIRKNQRL